MQFATKQDTDVDITDTVPQKPQADTVSSTVFTAVLFS